MGKRLVRVEPGISAYVLEQLGKPYEQGTEEGADAIRVVEHLLKLHQGWDVPLDVEDNEPEAETGEPKRTYGVAFEHPLFHDEELRERIELDEGRMNQPYDDSKGILTVGVGHNLRFGVSEQVIDLMLDEDLRTAIIDAERLARKEAPARWDALSVERKRVLVEMVFQMGYDGVSRFKRMWHAIYGLNFDTAADEMLDSKWAREDSPARAQRAASRMRRG